MKNPDLDQLRNVLNDAAVLCGRLSSQVSFGEMPGECAGAVAALRHSVLAAQQGAALLDIWTELLARAAREAAAGRVSGATP
jgi:hypothetical protein